jgi:hypothetical protein
LPDGDSGTVVRVEEESVGGDEYRPDEGFRPEPVTWPEGYTGRRLLGGEVEVLNEKGEVVVRTGEAVVCVQGFSVKGWFCEAAEQ